jgi:Mg2+ and Co2+ transporter CorA
MTKTELEKALTAYLDDAGAGYEDVIEGLTKSIKDYYDKKEDARRQEARAAAIESCRDDLVVTLVDYMEVLLDTSFTNNEYKNYCEEIENAVKDIEDDLTTLLKLTRASKKPKETKAPVKHTSDDQILRDFFSNIVE